MSHSDTEEPGRTSKAMADVIISSPLVKSFLAGSLSGTCSTLLFQPLDLLKTRLQQPPAAGCVAAFVNTPLRQYFPNEQAYPEVRLRGPACSSTLLTLSRTRKSSVFGKARFLPLSAVFPESGSISAPFISSRPASMCEARACVLCCSLDSPSPGQAMFLGASARSIAGVVLLPVTVIKTRFESEVYHYRSMSEATRDIYRTHGMRGLYSGLIPTLIRDAPYSGIYLVFYVQAKRFVPQSVQQEGSGGQLVAANFTCGLVAGLLASVVTQPADVIKTHMQLSPAKFSSILATVLLVAREEGVVGYFRGLVPRMLRRTLVTAMAWSFYEQVTKGFVKK
ncbi:mitochondrial glycine transporter A-like isoform X1 [Haemaphysalis longicornis]